MTKSCAACRHPLEGAYCSACGERRSQPSDLSLVAVLREQLAEVSSADGRLWRTLRLVFAPGVLTEAYFAGQRSRYLRPVRLFLVLNVVLFFAASFLGQNPLMGELDVQLGAVGERGRAAVEASIAEWGGSRATYAALFDQRAATLASTLIGLFVLAFAALFGLAFPRGGGARHVVFALHAVSAFVAGYLALIALAVMVVLALALVGIRESGLGPWFNVPFTVAAFSLIVTYLALGFLRVYGVRPRRAWLSGAVVGVGGLPATILVYKPILFWLTLWTLRLPPM